MALHVASSSRANITGAPPPERSSRGARAALLARLQEEATFPTYSRVVIVGVARLVEGALLTLLGLALQYAVFGRQSGLQPWIFYAATAGVVVAAALAFQALRTYSIQAFRHPIPLLLRLYGGWGAIFLTLFAAAYLMKFDTPAAHAWITAWFWLGLGALTLERLALATTIVHLAHAGRLERRAVMVGGDTDFSARLLRDLAKADPSEARLLGLFDDRGDERSPATIEGVPKLGNVDDLVIFARAARVDLVIFALPISAEKRILEMLRKLWVLPIDVRLAAHANRLRLRPRAYSYIGRAPMLDVFDKPLADWDIVIKNAFDRVVGALALIALSPAMLIAAVAVKLDSRGPVLFRQKRYGFNNELIEVVKFRTMRYDRQDLGADRLVTRGDDRVTRVGRILRRTSIDELPQLLNVVFKGHLSLVGPRPHAVHAKAADRQYDEVVEGYFARHRVKPGLTGWAQINGWRGETDTPEKIQNRVDHDLYYIENWSILLDLYILAMTPIAMLMGKNAF